MCADFYVDRRDIFFNLHEFLHVEDLCQLPVFAEFNGEVFDMVVDEAIKFAKEQLAPVNAPADKKGATFDKGKVTLPEEFKPLYKTFCAGGWVGAGMNPKYGGQGLPETIAKVTDEIFFGACTSFALTQLLTRGAGHLIEHYGSEALKNLYCEKMYGGQWGGTMCLTESSAGSDVGASKTTAQPEDGHYLIQGTKIFITAGEHDLTENIIHLVLARRTGAPKGTKGISLFVVPKFRSKPDGSLGEFNDVICGNIEHKMGIKASPTCTLNFGDDNKCWGWLLGEPEQGMRYMFQMMNEARLEVGLQGHAAAAAAYLSALYYAQQRLQGQHLKDFKNPDAPQTPIINHPDVRRMLMFMRSSVEGMRALLLSTARYVDLSHHAASEDERTKHQGFVELLTPICKAYCSDLGFRVCETAIQTYGGYGYCQEYPVEQYCRDVKIASIYEGANGIQAMDLLVRKVGGRGGLTFMTYLQDMNEFIDQAAKHPAFGGLGKQLAAGRDTLAEITMFLGGFMPKGDLLYPMLHVTPYLRLFGHVVIARYLLAQAVVAEEKLAQLMKENGVDRGGLNEFKKKHPGAAFYDGKIQVTRFFFSQTLPEIAAIAHSIKSEDRSALEVYYPEP